MSQVINTNVMSLNAQRNLANTGTALATSLERLSSGLRINSAKDDAAGLAISERFTTQIRGLNQAVRNANDGISLAQTGEGAIAEISNNLQRIRELAVQAANATNSESDRAALDQEVQQRLAEIDRISSQTSFNGQKILDGSFGSAVFQVGANAGQTIGVDLQTSMRQADIGSIAQTESSVLASGSLTTEVATRMFGAEEYAGTKGEVVLTGVDFPVDENYTAATAVAGLNIQELDDAVEFPLDLTASADHAQFNVTDGTDTIGITLSGNYDTGADLAADIQGQLQAVTGTFGDDATVGFDSGRLTFTNVGNEEALAIQAVDENAADLGIEASAGLDGGADLTATFTVDGNAVTLDANYDDIDAIAAAIQTQIGGDYAVVNDGGTITITNNDVGTDAPEIVATNAAAYNDGWNSATANFTETDGDPAVSSGEATFEVDGIEITLDQDYASFDAMATAIQDQLNDDTTGAGAGAYSVVNNNGTITINNNELGSDEVVISNANAIAGNVGFDDQTGVSGLTGPIILADGDLVIAGVDMAGSYDDAEAFAGAINRETEGVFASITDDGRLELISADTLEISGNTATSQFGFTELTVETTAGSLNDASVVSVEAANETMVRIDAALTEASSLRSTFGAIQNRFDSTIANLSTTVENLSASRSRILDADFAAETANLTRAQILQQAGTAMLAQANQVPQNVLSLLR